MLRAGVQNNKPQDRPYGEKRTIPITPHTSLWGAAPAGSAIVTGATEGRFFRLYLQVWTSDGPSSFAYIYCHR